MTDDRQVPWPLLAGIPELERRAFLSNATRHRFRKGDIVFHEGDPGDTLHLIDSGSFLVRKGVYTGHPLILALLPRGNFFGLLALLPGSQGRRSATVAALERSDTLALYKNDIDRLRSQYPGVTDVLMHSLGEHLRHISNFSAELVNASAEKRILRHLIYASHLWDGPKSGSTVHLTQEHLAELAGATRQTANQVLREAEHQELVKVHRGTIQLIDLKRLFEKAGLRNSSQN